MSSRWQRGWGPSTQVAGLARVRRTEFFLHSSGKAECVGTKAGDRLDTMLGVCKSSLLIFLSSVLSATRGNSQLKLKGWLAEGSHTRGE